MKILFYDVETTGLHYWRHSVHQIAGIIEIDGEVKETFDFRTAPYPSAVIDPAALKVSSVTEAQIKAYPDQKSVHEKLTGLMSKYVDKFDKKDKFYLAGFNNASFDNNFLQAFFKQCGDDYMMSWFWAGSIDIMVLASMALMEKRTGMKDFKLVTVALELGIEVDTERLHDGSYDIELTRSIYHALKPTLF